MNVKGDQPSGESSSNPRFVEEVEGTQEPIGVTQGPRSSVQEWVNMFTQAVATVVGSSSGSRPEHLEAANMVERVRRLRAQEF